MHLLSITAPTLDLFSNTILQGKIERGTFTNVAHRPNAAYLQWQSGLRTATKNETTAKCQIHRQQTTVQDHRLILKTRNALGGRGGRRSREKSGLGLRNGLCARCYEVVAVL